MDSSQHCDTIDLHRPSPVRRLLVEGDHELWVKDDGLICSTYGGNKPRKLLHLLADAQARRAKRLVTIGAVGSHHVLATGVLGKQLGLPTMAIALPRPYSYHAEQTTKQTIAAGVELVALANPMHLPNVVRKLLRRGDYWIPPGGSNGLGALGYLEAALELEQQILGGQLPEPDLIVVALGSGGTAAGLLAGLASSKLRTHLVGALVLQLPMARSLTLSLARSASKRNGYPLSQDFSTRLTIDDRWIGKGYGHATTAGELALAEAATLGLTLEGTYTAKAFASALAWLRTTNWRRILFWSTFSAVSLATATTSAVTLPPAIGRLLRPS